MAQGVQRFFDRASGQTMGLRMWGGEWWLFRLHADGENWVSVRKATPQDLSRLDMRLPKGAADGPPS